MIVLKTVLSGFSILIAGIIAIIRFRKIGRMYYPFIFCVWIAGANELLSYVMMETGHYTVVNSNIYVLAESILFTAFFKNLGVFEKFSKLFVLLITALVMIWCWENFLVGKITELSSWFRIDYSFCLVLMSITAVNQLLFLDINKPIEINSRHILKNPVFLICIGSIVYFTLKVLVEIFWMYGRSSGKEFRIKIHEIMVYVNIAVNILYALAVLWVPTKQQYMTLS